MSFFLMAGGIGRSEATKALDRRLRRTSLSRQTALRLLRILMALPRAGQDDLGDGADLIRWLNYATPIAQVAASLSHAFM